MAAPLLEEYQLTPEQRRRLGAVYQLLLRWRRENNDQQASQTERPAQTAASTRESPAHAATLISEV